MISIKQFLDGNAAVKAETHSEGKPGFARKGGRRFGAGDMAAVALDAYRSILGEIGRSSADACASTGQELVQEMAGIAEGLHDKATAAEVEELNGRAQNRLQEWGRRTARHFQQKTAEVKEILMVMAQTAESVGERDQRCAQQITVVTTQLRTIANLDDLTQIRRSIERSATELKTSIDRMNAEGKAVLDKLQAQVSVYQTRMQEAEEIASCDAMTRLRSRLWMEGEMEKQIARELPLCIAILDVDDFKRVNDSYGHLVGDELLKQFAAELRSVCRSTDPIARWGGDEFLVLMDCDLETAQGQAERLCKWVCGNYTVTGVSGTIKLRVDASIGLAEYVPREELKQTLARADAAMYRHKATKDSLVARAQD